MLAQVENEENEQTLKEIVALIAKLLETIEIPTARSAIIWVIGEYSAKAPLLGPDILRKLAKTFKDEDSSVKLQILNLGAKLNLTNSAQTNKIFQYILNLGRYDTNFDVRDRVRLMKVILVGDSKPILSKNANRLFITKKNQLQQMSAQALEEIVSPYLR